MMYKKNYFLRNLLPFMVFSAFTTVSFGQIIGTVKDINGEPLVGVSVIQKGTTKGVVTDAEGNFNINIELGTILKFSSIGYNDMEQAAQNNMVVIMEEGAQQIGDVVVVGFGTQRKENITGAVAAISMDKALGDRPITSVGAALQGNIPGLVITGNMNPGSALSFNIRGTTSINGGSPLILVDGAETQINLVNPEDIESVSILKDASSAAIYGARAAFGVILITTKKAKKNSKMQLNYNNNFSFSKSINVPVQASVLEILQAHLDFDNDGKYFAQSQDLSKWIGFVHLYNESPQKLLDTYPGSYLKDGAFVPNGESIYYWLRDNNPQAEILDKFGFQQTHNISASGGSEKITYRLSLGYTNNDGPLITNKDQWERLSTSAYVSGEITKWLTTSLNMSYAFSNTSDISGTDGNIYNTYFRRFYPITAIPNSTDLTGEKVTAGTPANYIRFNDPLKHRNENPRIFSRTSITPFKGFEGIIEYTFDQNIYDYKYYTNNWQLRNDQMAVTNRSNTPTYFNTKNTTRYSSLNAYATYEYTIPKTQHNFKLMGGFAQERRYYESLAANRKNMINPDMPSINGAVGEILANDDFSDFTIRSGYFRFNYNFMNKYLLEVNGRYDGSSRFPKSNRFGFFPSGSIGWQIAKESFMDWSKSWLNEFKPRLSWGQVGNQSIDNYLYTPAMVSQRADWIVGTEKPVTLSMPAMVRNNFAWEIVETLDVGLDFALFSNRLTGTFGWYRRDTKGMLAPGAEFPAVVGTTAPFQNAADLRTSGWELNMSWRDNIGDWNYGVGFNIYDSKAKITKFKNEAGLLFDKDGNKQRYVGETLGEIWGYTTDGYYTINDFKEGWQNGNWQLKDEVVKIRGNSNIRPGDVKFVNLRDDDNSINEIYSGDNTVSNPGDQKVIGNNTARYQFGVNANVGWKGFDFSIFMNGTGKRDVFLSGDLIWPLNSGTFGTLFYNQLDYWKPVDAKNGNWEAQNPNARYPRIYNEASASGSNYRTQTKYLYSAAYFRIKNITLSYSFQPPVLSKIKLAGLKLFFSAENILTISTLPKGYDPERLDWGYPFYAIYSFGLNVTL